ncbi:MAG: Na+/H+ antiporter NhaC family protein, partial [Helicobacter sp.]|nr:Na+/H+ antiporter NhaC family protein [Helicobacter sp.]
MYADSVLSLVVPLCVIALVFITKRVVLSLFIGIAIAGVMITYHNTIANGTSFNISSLGDVLLYIYKSISSVFYSFNETGSIEWESSNLYVFGFLIILGIITQMIAYSGGIAAFVQWARNKVNTATGSEFLAFIAGIVIFIDDYFNALTVGQLTKSLNDANHSTRERLAYIIDSTSAPICILMPISSWGAYILGIMATLGEGQDFFVLLSSIWANYYAWFALLAVFLTIYWQINLPAMKKYQNVGVRDFLSTTQKEGSHIRLLIVPIFALIGFITLLILWTGYKESGKLDLFEMLANTQTGFSLFWGGLGALVLNLLISWKHLEKRAFFPIFKIGTYSMIPASFILVLAWSIGPVIKEDIQTGIYLANLTKVWLEGGVGYASVAIPLAAFAISAFIAFCTGTSWGTFAIMLPIGLNLATINDVEFAFVMSAILSGAVYGDHSSPISDTTILSATGAGCSVESHFITQLPYVSTTALVAFVSFATASYFDSIFLGYAVGILLLLGIFGLYKK